MWVGLASGLIHLYNVVSHEFEGSFQAHNERISWMLPVRNQVWTSSGNKLAVWEDGVCYCIRASQQSHSTASDAMMCKCAGLDGDLESPVQRGTPHEDRVHGKQRSSGSQRCI